MKKTDKLKRKIKNEKWSEIEDDTLIGLNVCPECYEKLENVGGCKECFGCGFSVCQ